MTNDPVLLIVQWLDSILCNQYIAWNEENFKFIISKCLLSTLGRHAVAAEEWRSSKSSESHLTK